MRKKILLKNVLQRRFFIPIFAPSKRTALGLMASSTIALSLLKGLARNTLRDFAK